MPVKYKGILKIIFGIYTCCQQIEILKVNSSVRKIYILRRINVYLPLAALNKIVWH